MTNGKNNAPLTHTTSTSPIKGSSKNLGTARSPGGSSSASTPRRKPLTDSTERTCNTTNTAPQKSDTASAESSPTSSQFTMLDTANVVDRSRKYLNNLIDALESGKHDVEMFVLLLQNISNGDDALLCQRVEQKVTIFAVSDMIEETIQRMIKKRDDLCVDDDKTKREWLKLDHLIAALALRQETLS